MREQAVVEHETGGASEGAAVGRAKYLRGGARADDEGPIVTMTRSELRGLVREAVAEAMGMASGPVLVDKAALAGRLGCSVTHVDSLRRRGMPTVLVGSAVRFEVERCVEWLRASDESPAA